MASPFAGSDSIRAAFAHAMADMYRTEVPLYHELTEIVVAVNNKVLDQGGLRGRLARNGELDRLSVERHGAIRVGTPAELSLLRRVFAVMGMHPVGYYDLSVAGVPVHSTAFRPIDAASLAINPFRVFTSLLRLELIPDGALRRCAADILRSRQILSQRALALLMRHEQNGGLQPVEADEFVAQVLETFRWQRHALVDRSTYQRLNDAHRLVADVVSFRGPHINHLTPRTLDIDLAQEEMKRRGMEAKAVIEGPPRRNVPILLRQTSFKALEEPIVFLNSRTTEAGTHTARFGEIEQRGAALTPAGRKLYDDCLNGARGQEGSTTVDYGLRLEHAFRRFPDDLSAMRQQGLAYFRYARSEAGHRENRPGLGSRADLDRWIDSGWVTADPIVYEDFLPVSAAGIFQSNLGGKEQAAYAASASQRTFEEALGVAVHDPFSLYRLLEQHSLEALGIAKE